MRPREIVIAAALAGTMYLAASRFLGGVLKSSDGTYKSQFFTPLTLSVAVAILFTTMCRNGECASRYGFLPSGGMQSLLTSRDW